MNRDNMTAVPLVTPMAQNLALDDIASAKAPGAPQGPLLSSPHPLHGIQAVLQVCVGHAQVTVGDLLNATEQRVVVLDRTPEQPVDLLLNGQVVARGHLVAVDGHFAVRISELPLPLTLAAPA
jgi:flagellar motor switch protein FliN/FliY